MFDTDNIEIRIYKEDYKNSCMAVFDQNTPAYFALNERTEFHAFLSEDPTDYYLLLQDEIVIASYGLRIISKHSARIHWIMVNPENRGGGLGDIMMKQAIKDSKTKLLNKILIAASQKSAPFFAKYGAKNISTTKDGWGIGMDKIDMEIIL